MQQYVIFNVLKEYCIPKEEEDIMLSFKDHRSFYDSPNWDQIKIKCRLQFPQIT